MNTTLTLNTSIKNKKNNDLIEVQQPLEQNQDIHHQDIHPQDMHINTLDLHATPEPVITVKKSDHSDSPDSPDHSETPEPNYTISSDKLDDDDLLNTIHNEEQQLIFNELFPKQLFIMKIKKLMKKSNY